MSEHDRGHLFGNRVLHVLRRRRAQLVAFVHGANQSLCHVEIRRKISAIAEDNAPAGPHLQRGSKCLIDLDRKRVAGGHGSGRRTDQAPNPVPHSGRQRDPVRRVPGPDQLGTPLGLDHLYGARGGPFGQRSQGVAIKINHAFRQCEHVFARQGHSSPLRCHSSGKSSTFSIRRRYSTPAVPPVPRLNPITRSTVVTWLNRQRRK